MSNGRNSEAGVDELTIAKAALVQVEAYSMGGQLGKHSTKRNQHLLKRLATTSDVFKVHDANAGTNLGLK